MTSLDIKIISAMRKEQEDSGGDIIVGCSSKKKNIKLMIDGSETDLITYLSKIRRIKIENLNKKATVIQRWWKNILKRKVLPFYSKMMFKKRSSKKNEPPESDSLSLYMGKNTDMSLIEELNRDSS